MRDVAKIGLSPAPKIGQVSYADLIAIHTTFETDVRHTKYLRSSSILRAEVVPRLVLP